MVRLCAFALALLCAGPAFAQCRQALALGLDVSGSVDRAEYRLQLDGVATALLDEDVRTQILASPSFPVWIAVFEWAGRSYQRDVLTWTPLTSEAALNRVAATLRGKERDQNRFAGGTSTAIGAAMTYADRLFAQQPGCWRYTLDLSGDGTNNDGPLPELIRDSPAMSDVLINGLVIAADEIVGRDERQMEMMELSAYYRRRVIRGPDAFIEIALGFDDYARAMTRKLLRETESLAVGGLDRQQRRPNAAAFAQQHIVGAAGGGGGHLLHPEASGL